jgi:multidrug efflux pump subunit AcrA (membrane-fusion protein)
VLIFVCVEDRVGGPFEVAPTTRAEVRAPVAGFLREVFCDEGERVYTAAVVARLEIPDLDSQLAQKRAAVREAAAHLRLLEIGTRPEEVTEQRGRVERAQAWRDRADKRSGPASPARSWPPWTNRSPSAARSRSTTRKS